MKLNCVISNLYINTLNYFSIDNYLITFIYNWQNLNDNPSLTICYYQNILNYFLFDTVYNLQNLALFNINSFLLNKLFNQKTNFNFFSKIIYNNIYNETHKNYNINNLRRIFPEFREDLEMFEDLSYSYNNDLYTNISTPNCKLYYPEPFIATPSFVHEDIWFINILQYQHWLWFFFISLIMFYFITFINVVRWCNQRVKPKRETRGVSRSKCADLITACVPVSWAASIIITESVDAADYYDGFGTGEIIIGIRAYQWGWEYFYPKNIDVNYIVKPNYSFQVGNSLKYTSNGSKSLESNVLWKHYQLNTINNISSTPILHIIKPINYTNKINLNNFNEYGINILEASNAFKKIQFFSKNQNYNIFAKPTLVNFKILKITDLYYNDFFLINSKNYGSKRQHNYLSKESNNNSFSLNFDILSIDKYEKYLSNQFKNNSTSRYNKEDLVVFKNKIEYNFLKSFFDKKLIYNFEDLKSINQNISSIERDSRFINNYEQKNLNNLEFFSNKNICFPLKNNTLFLSKINNFEFSSNLLQSKEESSPNFFFETYWLTYWNSFINKKKLIFLNYSDNLFNFYLPFLVDYIDYDFKNWQIFEWLEDSYWESSYLMFTHEDYLYLNNNSIKKNAYLIKNQLFSTFLHKFKFFKNTKNNEFDFKYVLPIISDEFFSLVNLIVLNDFKQFNTEIISDSFDNTYTNFKVIYFLLFNFSNYNINIDIQTNMYNSYIHILDIFTNLKEDNSWFKNILKLDIYNFNSIFLISDTNYHISNPLKLRITTRNLIITHNAIQKVFKSRFDEGRSNVKLQDISNSYSSYPFFSSKRISYENILYKNKDNFFNVNSYYSNLKKNISIFYPIINSLNIYFLNLPFLISIQSDTSRYLWFDWQSNWSSLEVQPSSVARYSLLGVPYINKNFEYVTNTSEELNENEVYFIRLSRVRKNYITTWAYSPFFYMRLFNWYKDIINIKQNINYILNLRVWCKYIIYFFHKNQNINNIKTASPSYSLYNTPGRESIQSLSNCTNFDINVSVLNDILTKREYLYIKYLNNKFIYSTLPLFLTSSVQNPLLIELKKTFYFLDSLSFTSEISREYFFHNINFFQLQIFKKTFNILDNQFFFLNKILNNLGLINFSKINNLNSNNKLLKNQYYPMKKGVINMIRLHATGAIALPIEIRLHILASSKDVIHSWAIPSAGIKIDCVPGYSSHRVMIFLVSGIYWGQCMEICGRFHHWMPIIIYFMKRDLFFLWCLHFQHFNIIENKFLSINKFNTILVNNISYSIQNWLVNSY
jgi:heme/copper-type cytochrome/quinol oxidase subunit 2